MNIRKIHATGFMRYGKLELVLPIRGVVLVTGPNGSGKSSLVECVSYGGWGETLRGTNPWRPNVNGYLTVHADVSDNRIADEISIVRTWKGGKKSLEWDCGESIDKPSFPTGTKAQEALENFIGPYDVWRRSHVFSSQDAAHFTMATDSERKRLLESLLGLGKFDAALRQCRADLHKAEAECEMRRTHKAVLDERLKGTRARLKDAQAAVPEAHVTEEIEELTKKFEEIEALRKAAENEQRQVHSAILAAQHSGGGHDAAIRALSARAAKLEKSQCDSCGQPISDTLRAAAAEALAHEKRAAEVELLAVKEKTKALEESYKELNSYRLKLDEKLARIRGRLIQAQDAVIAYERQRKIEAEVTSAIAAVEADMLLTDSKIAGACQDVVELRACEEILGYKGVRAHMLGRALSALEGTANAWLMRIAGPGTVIHLKPYVEKKSGGISDSISLEVEGVGGGYGYRAASGGERRRVDVALLLGMASIAEASNGGTPGTLFFDEVFDSLDQQGVAAVWDILSEIAAERAVVVISHNEQVWGQAASAALHLRVLDGSVVPC